MAQKWNGSRSNVAVGSSIAGHVQKLNLVFENLRKREVEPLLHSEGRDVVRGGRGLRFEVPV